MPQIKKQTPTPTPAKPRTAIERISPMQESREGIKISAYGMSGSGKTTFWATFPGKILVLICSGGNRPGELLSIDTPEYRKKIDKVVIESPEEIRELIGYARENSEKYQTVVLDHASGLQDLTLKLILGLEELPPQMSWGLATQQQYGQLALQMKEYLRALLNLPQNVFIVAQQREFNTDGNNDEFAVAPYVAQALSPSIVAWLNPAVDYVVQTFKRAKMEQVVTKVGTKNVTTQRRTEDIEYCLRVGPDSTYTTKVRIPKGKPITKVIVDPDYDKLMKVIGK